MRERVSATGIVRARDLAREGVPSTTLTRLVAAGDVARIGRGLYAAPDAPITEHHDLARVALRVPHGIVCLLSALSFHHLGTQIPADVWLAIPRTARKPKLDHPPLWIVRCSGERLHAGVETHVIEGVPVRITSAARTVADCFRYRNKLGMEVPIEALRDYIHDRVDTIPALDEAARVARVGTVITPYMEALL